MGIVLSFLPHPLLSLTDVNFKILVPYIVQFGPFFVVRPYFLETVLFQMRRRSPFIKALMKLNHWAWNVDQYTLNWLRLNLYQIIQLRLLLLHPHQCCHKMWCRVSNWLKWIIYYFTIYFRPLSCIFYIIIFNIRHYETIFSSFLCQLMKNVEKYYSKLQMLYL